MSVVDFYHYTSESCAEGIMTSRLIRMSLDGGPDAHFGSGVYGTKLPPSAGKKAIAKNNWMQGWKNREKKGRVDYFFKITIPKDRVREYVVGNRHIYLYPGDLHLDLYPWECFEV